jgi:PAS domain S-box-containing protein
MLRWIRRALIAYSLHFLVGYGLAVVLFKSGTQGTYAYVPLVAIVVILQMILEVIATKVYAKRSPWAVTLLSFGFALLETFIAAEATGVYKSPYFIVIVVLTFIGQALGPYVAPSIVFTLLMGFALGVGGFFNDQTNIPLGVAAIVGSAIAGVIGYFFWRGHYTTSTNDSKLGSMLHLEQLKSNLIIDSIDDGVVLIDNQHVIRLFNPAAAKISGWKANDANGLDYKLVFKLTDQKGTPYKDEQDPFAQVFSKGAAVHDNNAVLVNTDGKPIAVTLSISPLLDANSTVTGLVGIFRDVSQERGQERRSADFVSTASHEMRTPVAAIEGYLALALNDRVSTIDSKARSYLEKAHESTQHLGKLFQDLLTSTKAEDGRLSSHPGVIEMSAFTEKVVEDLRFSAEKKGLHMEYVMGTHDDGHNTNNAAGSSKVIKPFYYVHADPERVREVITNLFDNAVKYTESGSVTIGLTGNKDVVQLSVRDTGPGIPEADIPHLFQKFYRVDNTATRTIGGTGLGLFICAKIIELYNGRIWVESKLGNGSTFYINLPRLTDQKAKELQAAAATATPNVTPLPTRSAS